MREAAHLTGYGTHYLHKLMNDGHIKWRYDQYLHGGRLRWIDRASLTLYLERVKREVPPHAR